MSTVMLACFVDFHGDGALGGLGVGVKAADLKTYRQWANGPGPA